MAEIAADLIAAFNAGRDPSRLALKYKAMYASPFSFLRGTAHLFHSQTAKLAPKPAGPVAWNTGDLHLENFGSYRGADGQVYFDVNDFDESALAPCSWDVLRLATSVLVAATVKQTATDNAIELAAGIFESYRLALAKGTPGALDKSSADGAIADLFDKLKRADPAAYVLDRTIDNKGERLDVNHKKIQAISDKNEFDSVRAFVESQVSEPDGDKLYKFRDAAFRIAGTGSLGIRRYIVLVELMTAPNAGQLSLLDIKQSLRSSLAPVTTVVQPAFKTEAVRIVAAQTQAQVTVPPLLQPVELEHQPFVKRTLQPTDERLNLEKLAKKPKDLAASLASMATLSAWAQLRSAGHLSAAPAQDLIAFASDPSSLKGGLAAAQELKLATLAAWKTYCKAYDEHAFDDVLKAAAPGKDD